MTERRFIIISHGRAGTNFLVQSLNASPRIKCYMEPFNEVENQRCKIGDFRWQSNQSSWRFANNIIYKSQKKKNLVGFKIFHHHCRENVISSDIWRKLKPAKTIKIIFLDRGNILNVYLSALRARKTGIWHPKGSEYAKSYAKMQITVNVHKMMMNLQYNYTGIHRCRNIYSSHPFIHVTYEQFESGAEEHMARIYDFLGVPTPGKVIPFKAGTLSAETLEIENADEVRDALLSSVFSNMIKSCPVL